MGNKTPRVFGHEAERYQFATEYCVRFAGHEVIPVLWTSPELVYAEGVLKNLQVFAIHTPVYLSFSSASGPHNLKCSTLTWRHVIASICETGHAVSSCGRLAQIRSACSCGTFHASSRFVV